VNELEEHDLSYKGQVAQSHLFYFPYFCKVYKTREPLNGIKNSFISDWLNHKLISRLTIHQGFQRNKVILIRVSRSRKKISLKIYYCVLLTLNTTGIKLVILSPTKG
jgi:hypothetical protein